MRALSSPSCAWIFRSLQILLISQTEREISWVPLHRTDFSLSNKLRTHQYLTPISEWQAKRCPGFSALGEKKVLKLFWGLKLERYNRHLVIMQCCLVFLYRFAKTYQEGRSLCCRIVTSLSVQYTACHYAVVEGEYSVCIWSDFPLHKSSDTYSSYSMNSSPH